MLTCHQFFLQFVFWGCLFCAWTFSTLLGFVVLPRNQQDLDILKVVIIVLYVKQHPRTLSRDVHINFVSQVWVVRFIHMRHAGNACAPNSTQYDHG